LGIQAGLRRITGDKQKENLSDEDFEPLISLVIRQPAWITKLTRKKRCYSGPFADRESAAAGLQIHLQKRKVIKQDAFSANC